MSGVTLRWGPRSRVWAVAIVGLAVAPGCPRPAPDGPAKLGVRIEVIDGPSVGSRRGAWVHDAVVDALSRSEALEISDGAADGALSVAYREIGGQPSDGPAFLRLQMEVATTGHARGGGRLDATIELERDDGTVDLRRDLPVALERGVAVLDAKVAIESNDDAVVMELLSDDDPELVLLAVETVTKRRQQEAIDRVIPLLRHPDLRVSRAAVECVGRIGTTAHVPALIESAKLGDRGHAGRLYDALARLGGEQARGFLEFAARNEDDPALAQLAERSAQSLDADPSRAATPSPGILRGHR